MTFDEAEARFRELQARVQRGEPISRAEYEDQVSQLAVQDDRGVLWEINPRTGKWMYFDGAEWVGGIPPGRDTSTVMPLPRGPAAPSASSSGVRPSTVAAPPTMSEPAKLVTPAASPPKAPSPHSTAPSPSPRPSAPPTSRPVAPMSTSRPAVPAGAPSSSPRSTPSSPESVPPYRRVRPDKSASAPPPAAPGSETAPAHGARRGPLGGPNREWVPLAIGAVVLLFCAILLFVGGRFLLSVLPGQAAATPTIRPTLAALATNTPMPTAVRLPTQAPPAVSPVPVVAKVIEASVNVRAGPSTTAKINSKLKKGNTVSLIARNADGTWYQVTIAGSAGPNWVFGETLEITSGDGSTLPVAGTGAPAATKASAPAPGGAGTAATPTVIGARPQ